MEGEEKFGSHLARRVVEVFVVADCDLLFDCGGGQGTVWCGDNAGGALCLSRFGADLITAGANTQESQVG